MDDAEDRLTAVCRHLNSSAQDLGHAALTGLKDPLESCARHAPNKAELKKTHQVVPTPQSSALRTEPYECEGGDQTTIHLSRDLHCLELYPDERSSPGTSERGVPARARNFCYNICFLVG